MIGFEDFIMADGMPIYLQILLYIKRGAAAGAIVDGDELPSRRMLSALLGVNPNTVQKAYKMLEDEGLIASHAGAKSLMVLDETTIARLKKELLADEVRAMARSFRQMGLSKEEAVALLDAYWE
ncbi:MAG: GntR family transcriptional regulator [Clostridia bacterium]|nr:GntR family transcriptional regulator [Clostridia bacterium]